MTPANDPFSTQLRALQILVAALVAGAAMFLVVSLIVVANSGNKGLIAGDPGPAPSLRLATGVLAALAGCVLPGLLLRGPSRSADSAAAPTTGSDDGSASDPWSRYRSSTIVGAAMVESGVFQAGITYLLWGSLAGLWLGLGLLVLLATRVPLASQAQKWFSAGDTSA